MNTRKVHISKSALDHPVIAWGIIGLILYSIICFTLDTLPDLDKGIKTFLGYSETIVVILFTMEYAYRIYIAENRMKFIFSFYGLIDLIAILPFYLTFAVDLRTLRVIRLFRILRLLKLARYNKAISRFTLALYTAKEELVVFSIGSLILIYLAAVGIYHFEHPVQPEVFSSLFDALWWAVASLTTVGYGDIYPITMGGRIFTFCILMVGLGLVAVPTGIITSALSAVRRQQERSSVDE